MELYSVPHSDSVEVGISFKWTTIYCLTDTVGRWTFLQTDSYSGPQSQSVRDALFYKWTIIYFLTVRVRRWTLLQMDYYLLLHSDSTKMVALRSGPLSTGSQ